LILGAACRSHVFVHPYPRNSSLAETFVAEVRQRNGSQVLGSGPNGADVDSLGDALPGQQAPQHSFGCAKGDRLVRGRIKVNRYVQRFAEQGLNGPDWKEQPQAAGTLPRRGINRRCVERCGIGVGVELENNALRRRRQRSNDARCVSIVTRNDRHPDAAAQDRDNSKDDKGPGRAFGGTVNSGQTEDQEE